jgi:serine/threonine-protein kinase
MPDGPDGGLGPGAYECLPGSTLVAGRYRVLSLLGCGGMGSVYRVHDTELDQVVALKLLRADTALPHRARTPHGDTSGTDRLRREVRLARLVTHRNVARTYDIGEHEGKKFLTMEFVDGTPLSDQLKGQPLPLPEVLAIAAQICAGLGAAHCAGVVHRDLKPENIMICPDGRVVLTDFGIALSASAGGSTADHAELVGTPPYMAPEQVEQSPQIDGRADIYALGCLLYQLLTGALAWDGPSLVAVLTKRLLEPPPDPRALRPDLPEAVARLVLRCMARDPAARPQRAEEVERALTALAAGTAPAAPPVQASEAATAGKTVAVLPFRNAGLPEDDYLAQGFSEDLLDTLAGVRGLRVRSWGAVANLPRDRDPRELGRELGVQVVVEGSVRRAGERLLIRARSVSVADGFQLWGERFERPAADVLRVSEDVAHAIAGALTMDMPPPARTAPVDPRIPDLYLRARFAYRSLDRMNLDQAVALYEEALRLGGQDPLLYLGYALALARQWFFGVEGAEARARDAAARALTAAPSRGEPWLALATVKFQSGDEPGAVRDLQEALRRSPALADAHEMLGRILIETGPMMQGVRALETTLALDPGMHQARIHIARAYALLGRYAEARRHLERVSGSEAQFMRRVLVMRLFIWQRDIEGARAMQAKEDLSQEKNPLARRFAEFAAAPSLDAELITYYQEQLAAPHLSDRGRAVFGQLLCEVLAALGATGAAFARLGQAVRAGLMDLMWVDGCPLLAGMRKDPRFPPLRERVAERAARVREGLEQGPDVAA